MAALVYANGGWHEGNPPVIGLLDNAAWLASVVFDGARAFDGVAPDLDRHCRRVVASAESLMLAPPLDAEAVLERCLDGISRFPKGSHLYVRPMFYATEGFIVPEPGGTRFAIAVQEMPMPEPTGVGVMVSRFRRPARDMAPTLAKASCLYPNQQRAMAEARARGFANAVSLDPNGNVAELATANLWIVRDGVAMTPAWNGTFLNGITRQRIIALFRAEGLPVEETTLTVDDLKAADELFSTGNWGKVMPITCLDDRDVEIGPVYRRARELYMDFARRCPV
ncbi:MAG: branched-chain amino acid aminotransferase [Geminicoccaceae bacterium]|nr:branched-chain amino acid aminotransferase [Geminicoccaceae bacterium]